MKRKHQRLLVVIFGLLTLGLGVFLVLQNFNQNIIFFYTPTELQNKLDSITKLQKKIRVGGLIEQNSIVKNPQSNQVEFLITDLNQQVKIRYNGILPNLFAEGQGMVARGIIGEDKILLADQLLTKHDENYMPKEVVKALKDSGKWNK